MLVKILGKISLVGAVCTAIGALAVSPKDPHTWGIAAAAIFGAFSRSDSKKSGT